MLENIEIKYQIRNPIRLKTLLKKHPEVDYRYIHHQKDIYFNVLDGRLKIRLEEGQAPVLIHYHRSDSEAPRPSIYSIQEIDHFPSKLRELQQRYGIKGQVEKWRELYLFRNVRIHLDNVNQLGWFLELESVVEEGISENEAQHNLLQIREYLGEYLTVAVSRSYVDLLNVSET